MSYEIPQDLRYEEKLFFNLSLRQAAWLGAFSVLALAIFLKLNWPSEAKATIGILLILCGFGFAFLNLAEHIGRAAAFIGTKRTIGYFDPQMQSFLEVESIEHDTIFMKDGQAKAILQVFPINFRNLPESHRKAIITAYGDFLNSLDFPIQVAARTTRLSMDDYMCRMEKLARGQNDAGTIEHFNEFRRFMESYAESNGIKNRLFYIVMPSDGRKKNRANALGNMADEKILRVLQARVSHCQEKLRDCNITSRRLITHELIWLLSGYFDSGSEVNAANIGSVTDSESAGAGKA